MGNKKGKGVPVLRYIDTRFVLLQEEIDRRIGAEQQSRSIIVTGLEARLGGMNEFRSAMADQAARMMTREMFDAQITAEKNRADIVHDLLAGRLGKVEQVLDRQRGRQAAYAGLAVLAGTIVTLLVLAFGHVHFG